VTRFLLACSLLLWASPALAIGDAEQALEELYVTADILDKAEAALAAGNDEEGTALLEEATGHLVTAERLAPTLPRIAFERARLHQLEKEPAKGEAVLLPVMRGDLPITDRVRGVEMLDSLRADQGRPSLGAEWRSSAGMRDAGAMLVGVGAAAFIGGLALAFDSYVRGAASKIDEDTLSLHRFGWALAGLGGGLTLGGTGLVVVGGIRLSALHPILPGPWHLPNAPDGITLTLHGTLPDPSAVAATRAARAERFR
jgi:hypothetical protein